MLLSDWLLTPSAVVYYFSHLRRRINIVIYYSTVMSFHHNYKVKREELFEGRSSQLYMQLMQSRKEKVKGSNPVQA